MIYNILLKPDVSKDIKALLENFYQEYQDINIEDDGTINYELELKIKKINSKEINKNQYLQFIKYLDLYLQKNRDKFIKEIINDEVISYNDYEEDNLSYREIINERETVYMKKRRIEDIDFNLQNGLNSFFSYRLSLSREELIKKSQMKKNSNPFIRKRSRHSYYFKNTQFRIDLTEVNTFKNTINKTISDISTSYEVEIEFLNFVENNIDNDNITKFKNLFQIIKETLGYIIPDNHTLVSYDQYRDTIFKLLENHRDNKPVNIQKRHIDLLINNKYYTTNKLDGVKYNLLLRYDDNNNINRIVLINDRDIWFLYENSSVNENITTVIFDCEIIESNKTSEMNIEIYIFDTIYYSNDENILDKPIAKRLEIYNYIPKTDKLIINKKLYNGDIVINKKTYVYFPNIIDSIKYTIKNMYKNDNLNFNKLFDNNDGIIFQPYDTPYYSISQMKDKSKFLPILKWKFPEKVSIDFKIRKNKDNKYKLLSFIYQSNKEVDIEFTDEEGKTYELYLTKEEENILDNDMIIETVFDNEINKFIFHRIRHDKIKPNSLIPTARETFIDMKTKFTLSMLIDMLRLNKENIQEEYTKDDVVIDIRDIDMKKNEQYLFPMIRNVSMLKVTDEGIKNSINYKYIMFNIINDTLGYLKNYNTNSLNYLDVNSYIGSSYFSFYNYFKKSIAIENNKSNFEALKENSVILNTNKNYLLNLDITQLNEKELVSVFININPNIIFINFNEYYKNELYMDKNHEISLNEFILYVLKKVPNLILLVIKVIPGYKLKLDRRLPYKNYFNYMNKNVSDVLFLNRCLFIFRKIHNKIKSYLISNFCMNSYSILDIGSGKGGDLPKYKTLEKLRTIYLVEPNIDNIKELNNRLSMTQVKNSNIRGSESSINYIPFIGSGEDTELISKYVKEKVTNINMFFVLTFFFENEDKLNKLVNTIDKYLDNEGIFLCTFMDGYRTFELLSKEDITNDYYSIKKLSKLNIDTYNNKIEIDFKETQTATKQIEYLVYINILTEKLKERHIYLEEEHYLDEEYIEELLEGKSSLTKDNDNVYYLEDLNDKEKQLNKLYKYCVYKKILPIDTIEEETFKHLNPIIIPYNNSQYINEEGDGLNEKISEPIKLYCNIDKNKELICKNNYYRLGAIGTDNNCFFHSYLISSDFYNYNSLKYNEKIMYASKFREDTVSKITRDIFEYISLGSISYPLFLKEFYKEINMLLSTDSILSSISNYYMDKNYNVTKISMDQLRDIFTKYIFYEQIYSVDITNKILYIIDKIENDFYLVKDIKGKKNVKDINKISYIKELLLKTGSKTRENCYKDYIKSLLHKRERDGKFKYVKYVTNEDIEIFNYILKTNVILISDETLYPITYTNL